MQGWGPWPDCGMGPEVQIEPHASSKARGLAFCMPGSGSPGGVSDADGGVTCQVVSCCQGQSGR